MDTTLLYTGVACVIAAIVGGGLKGFGLEIPVLGSSRRQALLAVLGVVLVAASAIGVTRGEGDSPPAPRPGGGAEVAAGDGPGRAPAAEVAVTPDRAGGAAPAPAPGPPPAAPRTDVWMVVEGLEFFAARPGAQVRVVAHVNGTEYVYPSGAGVEWLEVGPAMSDQVFRLPPPDRDRYSIRFEADVRIPPEDGSPEVRGKLRSVTEHIVDVRGELPVERRYILHTFDPVHRARGARAEAELRYRITADPG